MNFGNLIGVRDPGLAMLNSFGDGDGPMQQALAAREKARQEARINELERALNLFDATAKIYQKNVRDAKSAQRRADNDVVEKATGRAQFTKAVAYFLDQKAGHADDPGRRVIPALYLSGALGIGQIMEMRGITLDAATALCKVPADYTPSDEVMALMKGSGY